MWIQPCQNQLASYSDFQPFTNLASRASGYPLLQKPHFQIMTIYNSFIIFFVGFLPLVGEFLPQTPDKNRRENFKNLLSELRFSEAYVFIKIKISVLSKELLFGTIVIRLFKIFVQSNA